MRIRDIDSVVVVHLTFVIIALDGQEQHMHSISHLWLTVYLGKLDFLSVTDFSLANLRRGNFIVWGLDMSSLPRSRCVVRELKMETFSG